MVVDGHGAGILFANPHVSGSLSIASVCRRAVYGGHRHLWRQIASLDLPAQLLYVLWRAARAPPQRGSGFRRVIS